MILRSRNFRALALLMALSVSGIVPMSAEVKLRDLTQDPKTGRITPTSDAPISPQEQIKMGEQAAQQVRQQMPLLPDNSDVTRYVQRLGEKIVSHAPGYHWPFRFQVVNQKDINAFALPGGPMFVNLGAVQQSDESQLAGVMAHELSHVILQHSARDAGKEQGAQVLGALGAMIAGAVLGNGIAGQAAGAVAQLGAGAWAMKYSRADETEADLLGAQLMYDAGYDPYSLVEFFDVLAKQGGSGPQFLSDHPNPGNRAQTVAQAIKKFPKKSFARSDSPQYASMKREALGMRAMSAQEVAQYAKSHQGRSANGDGGEMQQGAPQPVRANRSDVMPSGRMRSQDFGAFRMDYPDNWQANEQQEGGFIIAPASGVSQNSIAYGVTITGVRAQQQMSLDDATDQLVQGIVQSNPGTSITGSSQRITVDGQEARSTMLKAVSPLESQNGRQLPEKDWVVTMPGSNGTFVYAVFKAPEQDFASLRPTFEDMLRSLRLRQ